MVIGFVGEGEWSPVEVIGVENDVADGVGCEECGLEEPVEVDGGVVGHEGCAEVDIPGHFLLCSL